MNFLDATAVTMEQLQPIRRKSKPNTATPTKTAINVNLTKPSIARRTPPLTRWWWINKTEKSIALTMAQVLTEWLNFSFILL